MILSFCLITVTHISITGLESLQASFCSSCTCSVSSLIDYWLFVKRVSTNDNGYKLQSWCYQCCKSMNQSVVMCVTGWHRQLTGEAAGCPFLLQGDPCLPPPSARWALNTYILIMSLCWYKEQYGPNTVQIRSHPTDFLRCRCPINCPHVQRSGSISPEILRKIPAFSWASHR